MSKLFKVGIPILIVLLMLLVVGTGIALAKGPDITVSTQPAVTDIGPNGGWGYCPGPYWGGWSGGNSGNYPPCHGYWR
jgi:hypothetical protein